MRLVCNVHAKYRGAVAAPYATSRRASLAQLPETDISRLRRVLALLEPSVAIFAAIRLASQNQQGLDIGGYSDLWFVFRYSCPK